MQRWQHALLAMLHDAHNVCIWHHKFCTCLHTDTRNAHVLTDHDECAGGIGNGENDCPGNSTCVNTIGSFACSCNSGLRLLVSQGSKSCRGVEVYPIVCFYLILCSSVVEYREE